MKFFIDTEFMEDSRTIDLLSIAIVCEDGAELYLELDADTSKANEWVAENVLPHLGKIPVSTREQARQQILDFIGTDNPEFWGYYADYDWVAICQLFGRMVDIPKGWPMYCRDIKQLCDSLGNPRLPDQGSTEHHALNDARWNRNVYYELMQGAEDREMNIEKEARSLTAEFLGCTVEDVDDDDVQPVLAFANRILVAVLAEEDRRVWCEKYATERNGGWSDDIATKWADGKLGLYREARAAWDARGEG